MGALKTKYDHVKKAIVSFENALRSYTKWQHDIPQDKVEDLNIDYEDHLVSLRDSSIQRFEYSIDLLWKYLKSYLHVRLDIAPDIGGPSNIIRAAYKERVISEHDATMLLEMVKNRNLTSHIYKEEFTAILIGKMDAYCKTMQHVLQSIAP